MISFFKSPWATLFFSLLFACSAPALAQQKEGQERVIGAEWHSLYSTHGDFFNGVSAMYAAAVRPRWRIGLDLECSRAPFHPDNGWKLYRLQFVPISLDLGYAVVHTASTALYAEVAPGLSWVRYTKQESNPAIAPHVVHEHGLYLYTGARLEENLTKDVQASAGAGIKNFHLSFDALDVNPHGIAGRAGLQYRFVADHD